MKTIQLTILLLPLLNGAAHAQTRGPVLLDSNQITHRLHLMETQDGSFLYAPTLLSQDFKCKNSVCTLLIYNQMDPQEESAIISLRQSGFETMSMRPDLFQESIQVQREALSGEVADYFRNFQTLGNLAILDNPYGSKVIKVSAKDEQALTEKYDNEGIGSYEVSYQLQGAIRDYSIRANRKSISKLLDTWKENPVTFAEIKRTLSSKGVFESFEIHGYTDEDTVTILAYYFRSLIMKSAGKGKLKMDPVLVDRFLKTLPNRVSIGETLLSSRLNCTARLEIKRGAEMIEKCEESREN
ncbi:MAG: hypothetical protein JST80_09890 [Bdellovibrionales bacterium]|nr:hypothetical protein [Bdellovibrionales bacterium]